MGYWNETRAKLTWPGSSGVLWTQSSWKDCCDLDTRICQLEKYMEFRQILVVSLVGLFAIRVLSPDMSWWLSMASQTCYLQDYSRKLLDQYCLPGVSWSAVTSKVASATPGSHSGLHHVGSADWRKSGERDPMKVESRTILSVNKCLGLCCLFFVKFWRAPYIQTYVSKAFKSSEFSMERCILF